MVIEFAPSNTRFLEGFWNFTIPEHRLSIPFLLVGRMTDPDVTLSTIALNFGSTLTGRNNLDRRLAHFGEIPKKLISVGIPWNDKRLI